MDDVIGLYTTNPLGRDCPVDSAIQRMNYRDISLRGRLPAKRERGSGKEGKGFLLLFLSSFLPSFLVPGTLYWTVGYINGY